tara:strand:+ start:15944 stop:16105 length:162 start_codon:yes stop_codon:yes gene_type:complete
MFTGYPRQKLNKRLFFDKKTQLKYHLDYLYIDYYNKYYSSFIFLVFEKRQISC